MKKLEIEQMEVVNGGNCFFAIPAAVLIGAFAPQFSIFYSPAGGYMIESYGRVYKCWNS